jgi:predicted protein tyrosine phosphatase
MNRIANSGNQFQGKYKRVLCVCSAGLLRSPTTAVVLSQKPYNFNTRAAGLVKEFALIPVDEVLLNWADEIVCMTKDQKVDLEQMLKDEGHDTKVVCLNIPDSFAYRDPKLVELIRKNYDAAQTESKASSEDDET